MFNRLPESNAQSQRRLGGLTVSTVLHLVVIALAVRATAWTAPTAEVGPVMRELPRYVESVPDAPPPSAPRTQRTARPSTAVPTPPTAPPVIGPIDAIPTHLPPAGSMSDLIRVDDFRPAGGTIAGDAGVPGGAAVADGAPRTERFVDRAVVALPGTTTPRYPAALQSAGLEGDVRAQFVVDTLGNVERGSIRVLDSTHDLFSRAVRDALARARFTPAEAGGRKVRQLVEQAFTFRIDPSR